jgi:hypothetical protein
LIANNSQLKIEKRRKNIMKNQNIEKLANLVSNIVGETITLEHIHIGTGREYYIQSPVDGAPMLLRHYRGPLFIDMSEKDYYSVSNGRITAEDYVKSANWMVGYYWGGGSMIGGGYYQPIDIINRSEEVKRYLHILSCRTFAISSGYKPTEEQCVNCKIKKCPFSSEESNRGKWADEPIKEEDPRYEIFDLLTKKFESIYPGYTLKGFLSSFNDGNMPTNLCIVRANTRWKESDPYSFIIWLSSETIRGLLMHTISMEDAKKIVDNITFYHSNWDIKIAEGKELAEVTMESIQEIFARPGMDRPVEKAKLENARLAAKKAEEERLAERAQWGIFGFIYDILHK